MKIERYREGKHLLLVRRMLEAMVAAMFIRKVEGRALMVDSTITNIANTPIDRNEAMEMLTRAVDRYAQDNGITKLIAFSEDNNTIERATKHGYTRLERQVVLVKTLRRL